MYEPHVNDYVIWKNNIQGWVYFKSKHYITIEVNVRPKTDENYAACDLHRNDRLLVLCYKDQWDELEYVGYRTDKYSKEILSVK
jgi:hypothetical protein